MLQTARHRPLGSVDRQFQIDSHQSLRRQLLEICCAVQLPNRMRHRLLRLERLQKRRQPRDTELPRAVARFDTVLPKLAQHTIEQAGIGPAVLAVAIEFLDDLLRHSG